MLLRNERVNTHVEETTSDVERRRSNEHVKAVPMKGHLSGSDDVIHCFSLLLTQIACFELSCLFVKKFVKKFFCAY